MHRRSFLKQAAAGLATLPHVTRALAAVGTTGALRTTQYGPVLGAVHNRVAVFLGIPYGADTRQTRFQAPLPPMPWNTPREALRWADRAPQLGANRTSPSPATSREPTHNPDSFYLPPDQGPTGEDCLHLNLWTPALGAHDHERRPVLVYIHGGAYNSGSANCDLYDGTRLCERGDVVVVTINHRLNAFGFLSLGEISADPAFADSGNAGMLDLVLAFRWVRDNIAAFGGDPACVTIFGQSGGGAKCATLMAMPAAHGLFHRVMTMSGQQVTAAPKAIATARAREFLKRLQLDATPPDQLRAALQALPVDRLEEAARVSSAWLPVVDGRSLPGDPFSPEAPKLSEQIPVILGNTHDETRGLIGSAQPALFSLTWEELPAALAKNVGAYLGPVSPDVVVARYREWYPQDSPADVFFAASTAFRSWPGQVIEAERRADSSARSRTWVYEMDWPSPVAGGRFGAPHTLDIPFFFDNLALAPGMIGARPEHVASAQALASAMSTSLLHFAATGDPNHSGLPFWPNYDLSVRATMLWNLPPRSMNDPRGQERRLAAQAHYRQPGT